MAIDLFAPPVTKKPSRQPAQKAPPLPPEPPQEQPKPEDPSILRRVGNVAGGGLSAVGNLLDVPGSVVRSVLRLHNPLDTILHPLSDVNRTSGRDLIRHYGLAGKEDTWGNFGAGLAADIALDPLTYLTGGAAAVGKGGKALKAAGVLDDAARVAAAKAGKAVSTIGKNEARLTTTAGDFLTHGAPEVAAKVKKLNLTPEQLNEPLGSLFRFGGHAVGTGPTAVKVAQGIDKAKSAFKFAKIPGTNFAPVNELHRLFHAPLKEATTPLGQAQSQHLFKHQEEMLSRLATEAAGHANEYDEIVKKYAGNAAYDDIPENLLKFLEMKTGGPSFPPEMHALRDKLRKPLDEMEQRALEQGRPFSKLDDQAVNYWPTHIAEELQRSPGQAASQAMSTFDPNSIARYEWRNGIPEGASLVKEIAQHPELKTMMDAGASKDDVAKWIGTKFGHRMPPTYASKELEKAIDPVTKLPVVDPLTNEHVMQPKIKDRFKDMAADLHGLSPETRAAGIYGNHPIMDWHHRVIGEALAHSNTEKVFETLAQPGVLQPPSKSADKGFTGIQELFSKIGLDPQLASSVLAQRTGQAIPQGTRIPADLAEDMSRMIKGFQTPNPVNPIMDAADSFQNIWKLGNTGIRPNFHVRNRGSGIAANILEGIWNPGADKRMDMLIHGKVVPNAANNPAVQELYKQRKLKDPLDDALGTKLLGELASAHGAAPKFEGEVGNAVGRAQNMQGASLESFLNGVPGVGRENFTVKKLVDLATGRTPGTTLNPLKADFRGVNGKTESTWGPAAAGNLAGNYIEGLNRGGPWLHLIEQGVDPAEAARQVGKVQGNYSGKHYTQFERQAMSRLFPFYKFTKFMIPHTANTLAGKPGGLMAQTIRVGNRSRQPDEFTPDYLQDQLSIPLAGIPGLKPSDPDTKRWLNGLGMMHEDPMQFLGNGVPGALLEGASRLNPLVKMPLELASNQSFFQRNAGGGGRSLDDLDPPLGRTISSIIGKKDPITFPGSKALEYALGNSPLASALTTVRQATDPRKSLPVKALNTLTGVKISDVSAPQMEGVARERVHQLMKDAGSKDFNRVYFPKDVLDAMPPQQRAEAMRLQAFMSDLAAKAKKRKELTALNGS